MCHVLSVRAGNLPLCPTYTISRTLAQLKQRTQTQAATQCTHYFYWTLADLYAIVVIGIWLFLSHRKNAEDLALKEKKWRGISVTKSVIIIWDETVAANLDIFLHFLKAELF